MFAIAMGLFAISLIVLVVDIFVEGFGPLAVVGILGVVGSFVMTAIFHPFGWLIILIKVAVLVPSVYGLFRFLRKKQLDGRFILNETLAEDVQDIGGLEYFLGKEGITKTALRPQGTADFNGTNVEVVSDSRFIAVDKRVKVIDVQNRKVLVKLIEN
ncbi:MAG: hypothetical protein FWE44_02650 [Defluviitaleaceae bacterium]|nr:hypothetical protein [Defluviitaleaceae bacterium]